MAAVSVIPGQVQDRAATPERMKVMQQDPDYFLNQYGGQSIKLKEKSQELGRMIYDFLLMIDTDNTGSLSAQELDEAADIIRLAKKSKTNNSAELNYKHMPKSVADVLSQWDADKSGTVEISELICAAEAQKKMKDENRMIKKLLVGAVVVIMILMAGTFGLALTAAEMAKDTKPDQSGILTSVNTEKDEDGNPMSTPIAVAGVKDEITLPEIIQMPPKALAALEDISFVHSHRFYSFKVAGVISSTAGVTVELGQSHSLSFLEDGTVTFDGENVDLSEERKLDEAVQRRRLQEANGEGGLPKDRMLSHGSGGSSGGSGGSSSSCQTRFLRSSSWTRKEQKCGSGPWQTVYYL